ncbi:MAG: cyclodeaminase/cyclohydrolase family protein [Tepidisphaeraceae bacterium]
MYDSKTTIEGFLNAAAAKQPTPGGGSVTALVGALAASMGEMVLNYSVNKKDLEPFRDELAPALAELHKARGMLVQLMIEDQAAYEVMSALRKLPDDSRERKDKYPAALLACIRVPQAISATALATLELSDRMVNFVNYHLLSDLAVCADLSMATIRCGIYNVRVNLKDVTDPGDRRSIESTTTQILSHAAAIIQRVVPRIWERDSQGA